MKKRIARLLSRVARSRSEYRGMKRAWQRQPWTEKHGARKRLERVLAWREAVAQ